MPNASLASDGALTPGWVLAVPLAAAVCWLLFAWWAWRVYFNARGEGDVKSGLAWSFVRVYCRVVHRLKITGREHIPSGPRIGGRPVMVVANHTAGLDPILLQAALPFFVRWVMAEDMRGTGLDDLWSFSGAIMVDRSGKADPSAGRAIMDTLKAGGAVGIFPEGALRRTPTELREFHAGVGLFVARGNAIVLPAVIRGTPHRQSSWASLFALSRSSVEFHAPIDYAALGRKAGEIAPDLRRRYVQWLGVAE